MSFFVPTKKIAILCYLRSVGQRPVTAAAMGAILGTSKGYISEILRDLRRSGEIRVVEQRRGSGGGTVYELI